MQCSDIPPCSAQPGSVAEGTFVSLGYLAFPPPIVSGGAGELREGLNKA